MFVASLLLILHLFAFGLYGLSVTMYELARRQNGWRLSRRGLFTWALVCLQFLPGMLLWYASLGDVGSTLTAWGELAAKPYALLAPATFGYDPVPFDRLIWLLTSAFLVFAITTRALRPVPEMRLPLLAMVVVAVIMPNRVSGSWNADIRLPVTLPFVVIASTRFAAARQRETGLFAAAGLVVLGLRVWSVSQSWLDYDRCFAEFRNASAVVTPGARLLIVEARTPEDRRSLPGLMPRLAIRQEYAFQHMAALAVIDRAAFYPLMFTGWTTIDVTPQNHAASQRQGDPMTPAQLIARADPEAAATLDTGPNLLGERPCWRNWPREFDFVLWIDFSGAAKPQLSQLQLLSAGSYFEVYRILRP